MTSLLEDLRKQIAKQQVVAIIGAGVSMGATDSAPTASWIGLLENGIARCEHSGSPRPKPGWGDRQRAALADPDLNELLAVASQIERLLGAPDGGEYRAWLRDSVGFLRAKNRAALEALRDLAVPLATTNYDGLLEEVTGLPAVTWRDGAAVQRVIRGDEPGILHFHGFWRQPESVVLGFGSYSEIRRDAHAQGVQSALALMKNFLFVGCGEGLGDPNFGALLQWMRPVLSRSEYRHFRLCRDSESESIQKLHPPEERIFTIAYGTTHRELAPFLQSLKPTAPSSPKQDVRTELAPLPPRPPRVFGRDDLVNDLVATLLLDNPSPVPVLGGPGFGKSTVCLAALHDSQVAGRFGARRWFIRCDAANTAQDVLKEIALILGLPIGTSLNAQVFSALNEAPGVVVLDNAETPWEADTLPTEDLLARLGSVPGLALVAAVRGQQRPHGPPWRDPPLIVIPLGQTDSRKAFLAIAGEKHAADTHLPDLLQALDGIPLAIELLAHAAEAEPNLDGLWQRWQNERVALLRRADGATRLVNAAVSFELSISGRRMTDEARQLLSVLAILPDGIGHEDLPAVMPSHCYRAAATLRQVGLAIDEANRLRLPSPIREHVVARYVPTPEALAPVLAHYTDVARRLGQKLGREGGNEAVRQLAAEVRNFEEIAKMGLALADPEPAIQAAIALSEFSMRTGLGTPVLLQRAREVAAARKASSLEAWCIFGLGRIALALSDHESAWVYFDKARELCRESGDVRSQSECIKSLGDVALASSDYDTARERYEEARRLYKQIGDPLGEANCIHGMAQVALRRSDHESARRRFEEARPLYHKAGSVLGEANCITGLAQIALERSDYGTSQARYEEALPLYRRVGELLGEANCIHRLGDIALARSDYEIAKTSYEAARLIFKKLGAMLGEANCIKGLGNIALGCSDHETALRRFEEARPVYRKSGNLLGEANCILGLGQIAAETSERDRASAHFEEALKLYERISEPYSIGLVHLLHARIATTKAGQSRHIAAARRAWKSIQREDLVQSLNTEFAAAHSKRRR